MHIGKSVKRVSAIAAVALLAFALSRGEAQDAKPPKPTEFTGVIPTLNVKSVDKSIEHYTTVLGFKKQWDYPDKGAHKTFASLRNGRAELFLCEGEQGSPGTWIYYTVGDVDALYKDYQTDAADIVEPPANKPWGMREMVVKDIDGHVLRIGQSIPEPAKK